MFCSMLRGVSSPHRAEIPPIALSKFPGPALSGYRDRDLLRAAIEETFIQHYGEEGGMARFILFSGLLEIRGRREGQNRRGAPKA
jgi:hypothetical protein